MNEKPPEDQDDPSIERLLRHTYSPKAEDDPDAKFERAQQAVGNELPDHHHRHGSWLPYIAVGILSAGLGGAIAILLNR